MGGSKLMKEKKEISVYFANWNLDRLPAEQAGEVAGLGIDAGKLCIGTPFYALAFKMKEMNPVQVVGAPCETYRA